MTKDIPEDLEHDNCCQHLLREQDSSGVSIVFGWREKQKKKNCIWLQKHLCLSTAKLCKGREQKADGQEGGESAGKEFISTGRSMACCKTDYILLNSVVSTLNPKKGLLQQAAELLVQKQWFEKNERQLELPSWIGSKK